MESLLVNSTNSMLSKNIKYLNSVKLLKINNI